MVVEICIIYYIKNNCMFRPVSLAIFTLINEKLSKQLHSTCVSCIHTVTSEELEWVRDLPTVYNPHKSIVAAY